MARMLLLLNMVGQTVDEYYAKRGSVADVEVVESLQQVRGSVNRSHCPRKRKIRSLQNVTDSISITARLLCLVESAVRVSRYVVQTVFANFMQHPPPDRENGAGATTNGLERMAGALGEGELYFSVATGLLLLSLARIIPIGAGSVADINLGRFNTVLIGVIRRGVSHHHGVRSNIICTAGWERHGSFGKSVE